MTTTRCLGAAGLLAMAGLACTPAAGRLVFALLESRSDDGVVTWNLLDDQIETDTIYPILRVRAAAPSPEP